MGLMLAEKEGFAPGFALSRHIACLRPPLAAVGFGPNPHIYICKKKQKPTQGGFSFFGGEGAPPYLSSWEKEGFCPSWS